MSEFKAIFFWYLNLAIIGYVIFNVALYIIYPMMTYAPPKVTYSVSTQIKKIGSKNELAIIDISPKNAKKTILYSHGNAANLGTIRYFLEFIASHGYRVISYDYPGYGLSSGSPRAQSTNDAIIAVYEYITNELAVPPDQLVIWGRSLGGGPSLHLLSKKEAGCAIIESTFATLHQVMTHWKLTPIDPYPNDRLIKQVKTPILLIHGKQDTLIKYWHAEKLASNCQNCELWLSELADHNDILLIEKDNYMQKITSFIDKSRH